MKRSGFRRKPENTRRERDAIAAQMRVRLDEAIAEAESRGWVCCGDLVDRELRASFAFRRLPLAQRLAFCCVRGEGGCWVWVASLKTTGYGQIQLGGRTLAAHRASYELYVEKPDSSLTLDHLCMNKLCVNPEHLEQVSRAENTRRWAATITACPAGHAFDSANTHFDKHGNRHCRRCNNDRTAVISARKRVEREAAGLARGPLLTDQDVETMRAKRAAGLSVRAIAAEFAVSASHASKLISGSRARRQRHTGPTKAAVRLVRLRSNGLCEFYGCSRTADHIHHRRPRRMGGTVAVEANLPSNLSHLCVDHHSWVESNRAEAKVLGLLLPATADPAAVPVKHCRFGWVLLGVDGSIVPARRAVAP